MDAGYLGFLDGNSCMTEFRGERSYFSVPPLGVCSLVVSSEPIALHQLAVLALKVIGHIADKETPSIARSDVFCIYLVGAEGEGEPTHPILPILPTQNQQNR